MLDWFQVLVLAIVQGLTEFLPVSSSAHLILVPRLLGWQDQGLAFDVAVHMGTLFAVVTYFRRDINQMLVGALKSLFGHKQSTHAKLFWFIGIATIPAGLTGLLGKEIVETTLRSPMVIGVSTLFFGLLLLVMDKLAKHERFENNLNWKDVMTIGCGQALALIPGTSRSGITLTTGLALGLTRQTAARFSFLLSIPVILLAAGYQSLHLIKSDLPVDWKALSGGLFFSALSGYFCIHYFLKCLDKIGVTPFVIYRFILGTFILIYFF